MMKKRTWIILAVIVLAFVGVKLWYDRLCGGDIDISDSALSKEMLLHILEHVDALADPASSLRVSAYYNRSNYSDFWDIVLPWSPLNLSFLIEERLSYAWLSIHDDNASAISDAPLREMMGAIVSVIGSP